MTSIALSLVLELLGSVIDRLNFPSGVVSIYGSLVFIAKCSVFSALWLARVLSSMVYVW